MHVSQIFGKGNVTESCNDHRSDIISLEYCILLSYLNSFSTVLHNSESFNIRRRIKLFWNSSDVGTNPGALPFTRCATLSSVLVKITHAHSLLGGDKNALHMGQWGGLSGMGDMSSPCISLVLKYSLLVWPVNSVG